MSESITEVLIVGAGPTGLMLACDLQRRGVKLRIIDRAEAPSQDSRAVGVQARTLELFDDLGILEDFLGQGILVKAIRSYTGGKLEHRFELNTEPTPEVPFPYLLLAEQHVTESVLTKHLRENGIRVERGLTLKHLQGEPEEVRCCLEGPEGEEFVRANYLVGCDGAHSSVRRLSGIQVEGSNSDVAYRLADVEVKWDLPHDEVFRASTDDFELVAMPLKGKSRYRINLWEQSTTPHATEELDFGTLEAAPTLEFMQAKMSQVAPGEVELLNPRSLMSYRTGYGVADQYQKARVFLAGDSAHLIPQSAAQGMNMGLQDAINLGWKLALVLKEHSPPELLESYQAERRQIALDILARLAEDPSMTRRAGHLGSRTALDQWSQLSLNYRACATHLIELPESTVTAGDRAPDGLLAADGQITDLHEAMTGLHHHMLAFFDQEDPEFEEFLESLESLYTRLIQVHRIGLSARAASDLDSRLHRAYSATHGDLVLVRPDGYLALRADQHRKAELFAALCVMVVPRVVDIDQRPIPS